jgi:hypothetical protein
MSSERADANYTHVYQQQLRFGSPSMALGSMGAAGGCVLIAAVLPSGESFLGHIDSMSISLVDSIPSDAKVTLSRWKNAPLIAAIRKRCKASPLEVVDGSMMTVCNSVVTMSAKPPPLMERGIEDPMVTLTTQLLQMARRGATEYECAAAGRERPPAPAHDPRSYYFNQRLWKWVHL